MHMHTLSNSTHKIPVAVVGGRGYSGQELLRLFKHHPAIDLKANLNSQTAHELSTIKCDVVFLATPAEASLELAPKLLEQGKHVIDLSGAFRLPVGDVKANYKTWYKMEHEATDLVARAQYGLLPWCKLEKKSGASLIANPGCYATATLLGILPLLKYNLIHDDSLVVDAKSGTTGAGKKAEEGLLFSEVDGECLPYKIGCHQHLPEITQWSQLITGKKIDPFFTTHLLPTRRGIIASIYAKVTDEVTSDQIDQAFKKSYQGYSLIKCGSAEDKNLLQLKKVVGTGMTHVSYQLTNKKLHVFSTIDNLLKGAASQALENFNSLYDLPLDTGLTHLEALT